MAFLTFSGVAGLTGATCGKSEPEDVAKEKPQGPDVQLEGIDTSALTPREKREWGTYVSEFLSPCTNVPVPIAQCVKEKRECAKCAPAAKYVLRAVKEGMTREMIEKSYKNRFDPEQVRSVPFDGSPVKGPESAAITIVEFADFECPFCGEMAPQLDKLVETSKDIRFSFKFYPLPGHPHARIAAAAAIAAWRQNKFWEMHKVLFANQKALEQSDLDKYAKALGLDLARFHADMQSPETEARIEQDVKLGQDLRITGTPSMFINGRLFDGHQDLNDWLALERQNLAAGEKPIPSDAGLPPRPRPDGGLMGFGEFTGTEKADAGKPAAPAAKPKTDAGK